ncbi:MAG TPA: DUF805 domain-containing protein [Pyrinomonadaceae bacterium]|nr:DUF805 domain-containing protein [Pyrinomonadaceae bacterium]
MNAQVFDVWSWHGKIGRPRYLASGLILLAIKHNVDRVVAASFGYPWSVFNYWVFTTPTGIETVSTHDAVFYAVLLVIALPFIWIGTVLTLRRLRDANLPLWLTVFFFLPFFNLVFFVILVAIPSTLPINKHARLSTNVNQLIPQSEFGSAALGILATAILSVGITALSAAGLGQYGWGLFVGIPFFLGLNSTLIYGFHQPRTIGKCLLVALLATALVGISLFALAVEGIICLAMAFPLAIVLSLFGGFIGFLLQQRQSFNAHSFRVVSVVFLLMPGLNLLEYEIVNTPPLYAVTTSVIIDAIPEKVWTHVVSFSQLPPPTETLFKTGIAYPIRAEITGKGAGAVRHCVFSTGEFVEPIRVWDQPRLLRFDVTAQPRAMNEMSLYSDLRPPHLEGYLISQKGQFELTPLADGKTLLEGTTWYQNRFWPAPYWHLWSDYIIHRIHTRVLTHIKTLAES